MAKGSKMKDWETPEALAVLKEASELTLEQIATEVIGISRATLRKWCVRSEVINRVLEQKLDEDIRRGVEAELIKNCFDRKMTVKKTKQTMDRAGNLYALEETKEYVVPGDFRAQVYFLNNRASGRWSAKPVLQEDSGEAETAFLPVPEVMEPEAAGEDDE